MSDYDQHVARAERYRNLAAKLARISVSFDQLADEAYARCGNSGDRVDFAYYKQMSANADRYLDAMDRVTRWRWQAWERAYNAKQEAKRRNGGRVITGE